MTKVWLWVKMCVFCSCAICKYYVPALCPHVIWMLSTLIKNDSSGKDEVIAYWIPLMKTFVILRLSEHSRSPCMTRLESSFVLTSIANMFMNNEFLDPAYFECLKNYHGFVRLFHQIPRFSAHQIVCGIRAHFGRILLQTSTISCWWMSASRGNVHFSLSWSFCMPFSILILQGCYKIEGRICLNHISYSKWTSALLSITICDACLLSAKPSVGLHECVVFYWQICSSHL